MLGVNRSSLYRQAIRGRIPAELDESGRRMYRSSEIHRILSQQTHREWRIQFCRHPACQRPIIRAVKPNPGWRTGWQDVWCDPQPGAAGTLLLYGGTNPSTLPLAYPRRPTDPANGIYYRLHAHQPTPVWETRRDAA